MTGPSAEERQLYRRWMVETGNLSGGDVLSDLEGAERERDEARKEAERYREALQVFPGLGSTFWTDEDVEVCVFCRGYRPDEDPHKEFQHSQDCPMRQASAALDGAGS